MPARREQNRTGTQSSLHQQASFEKGDTCATRMYSLGRRRLGAHAEGTYRDMSKVNRTEWRGRDKTVLVNAAVMFATEDHSTTCRKGGTEAMDTVYASKKNRSIREKLRPGAGCQPS